MEGRHQQNYSGGSHSRSRNTYSYSDYDFEPEPRYTRAPRVQTRSVPVEAAEDDWRLDDRRGGGWAVPVIILLVIILAALVGLIAVSKNITASNKIFPNVSVNGVDLSGLTLEQAEEKLQQSDLAASMDASVTVNLPDGSSVEVSAAQAGVTGDITSAAQLAYQVGRTGDTAGDMLRSYIACMRTPQQLTWAPDIQADEAGIRQVIEPAVDEANAALLEVNAAFGDEYISIVKSSSSGALIDEDEVTALVLDAFNNENYADIDITIDESEANDDAGTYAILESLYEAVYKDPVDASYDTDGGTIVDGEDGVSFDLEEAKELWDDASIGETVEIPLIFTEPSVTAEDLSEATFDDLLSEKSTTLSGSSSNRITNITLAAEALDGTVLLPGESFDYNSCLGERTEAKGYKEAGAYANGQHVTAIGGGICQASSTLYYCALYANLRITVRDNHYFLVSYLPRGLDATVSWGGPDFKFVNSRDYPIRINAWVSDNQLTVQIWGTDVDGSYVEITSDEWEDDQFYYAQTYRTVYAADGTVISTGEEAYSRYYKSGSESTSTAAAATNTAAPTETAEPTQAPEQTAAPVITAEPVVTAEPIVVTPEPVVVTAEPAPAATDAPVVVDPPADVEPQADTE